MHCRFIYFTILVFVFTTGALMAQSQDTTATAGGNNQIIDLSGQATIIKVEPEKPRVNIFSDRIKPEFDEVHLRRSFMNELTGKGEKVIVKTAVERKGKPEYIDIDEVVNKSR